MEAGELVAVARSDHSEETNANPRTYGICPWALDSHLQTAFAIQGITGPLEHPYTVQCDEL